MRRNLLFIIALIGATVIMFSDVAAQQLRTSYFMDKSIVRSNMNPALRPMRGYINIPVIGGMSMNFTSNSFSMDKIFHKKNGELVTFLDASVDAKSFLASLKKNNMLDVDYAVNIMGFGFYSKKAFWSFDITAKMDGGVNIPKSFFEFAKLGTGAEGRRYDLKDLKLNIGSTIDMALGYSRQINDKLSIGAKLKFIAGIANIDMHIDEMTLNLQADVWDVRAKGRIDASMTGLKAKTETRSDGKKYFNSFDYDFDGISGYGFGVDLGAAYKLLPQLTLSAAVLDLGFVNWSSKSTTSGTSAANYKFSGFDIKSGDDAAKDFLDDFGKLTDFEMIEAGSRTTSLRTTINIGAEYAFLNNQLSAGLLSSTQVRRTKTYSELTASCNWRPLNWMSATVSYSMIQSNFNTLGCAINISPSWIHLYLGTDYILGKVTPQFIPISQKAANVYFGIGIPLGKMKREFTQN